MAVKNLQTLVQSVAKRSGVVVTGTECKDSMRAAGNFQAPFLSLPSLPPAGPFPMGISPDNQGVLRAGRSACMLGVLPRARTSASYDRERTAMHEAARPTSWSMTSLLRG